MIDGQNLFDQPVKNDLRTLDNILKITTGQEDDQTTICLLDYFYFKEKLIVTNLSKKQALDADPKAAQLYYRKLILPDQDGVTTMLFILKEAKCTILDFSQGNVTVLQIYFALI